MSNRPTASNATELFQPIPRCWICGGDRLVRYHQGRFDFSIYAQQDPELAAYTGAPLWLRRCQGCGFGQPEALPTLPRFFDRMYDQRWAEEWMAWEFDSGYKDSIFQIVLAELARRVPPSRRALLDVGAHVGRLIFLARELGWQAEGVELNPQTGGFAARRTGLPIHRKNIQDLALEGRHFDAITIIDVLEHIPEPIPILRGIHALLADGGWVAVKVPHGPSQYLKERVRARLQRGYRATLADNLVHVNHFSPDALRRALASAGFDEISLYVGAPESPPKTAGAAGHWSAAATVRQMIYGLSRCLPGVVHTPLAMHLQAYARKAG